VPQRPTQRYALLRFARRDLRLRKRRLVADWEADVLGRFGHGVVLDLDLLEIFSKHLDVERELPLPSPLPLYVPCLGIITGIIVLLVGISNI
jgi:hypothetical protein